MERIRIILATAALALPTLLLTALIVAALLIWQPAHAQPASAPADGCPVPGLCVQRFSDPPPRPAREPDPIGTEPCRIYQSHLPAWYGPTAAVRCEADLLVRSGMLQPGEKIVRADRTGSVRGYVVMQCRHGRMQQTSGVCVSR